MDRYCVKCGKKFVATGREVICPACKAHAAEEAKKAAVLRAKRASWTGESVPVRISGRASTVIRRYGAENDMPFAAALDALLKASAFFQGLGKAWEDVEPYKSRRMKSSTAQDAPQDGTQDGVQDAPQDAPQASKASKASKASTSKTSKAAKK